MTQVALLSATAKRRPVDALFAFSLSVTIVLAVAVRSNATITYLPRSTGAGLALPNTPFFIMWTITPSASCSTRIGARYGSGVSANAAVIRPAVATASAARLGAAHVPRHDPRRLRELVIVEERAQRLDHRVGGRSPAAAWASSALDPRLDLRLRLRDRRLRGPAIFCATACVIPGFLSCGTYGVRVAVSDFSRSSSRPISRSPSRRASRARSRRASSSVERDERVRAGLDRSRQRLDEVLVEREGRPVPVAVHAAR